MTTREKIYFDACCFIGLIKHGCGMKLASHDDEHARRSEDCWFLAKLCDASKNGDIRIVTSILTISECTHLGDKQTVDQSTKDTINAFLTSGRVVDLVEADIFVAEEARALTWDHNIHIKGADAIHLATSLSEGCKEFITTDGKIRQRGGRFTKCLPELKKVGFRIIRGLQTLVLPAEYRTDDIFDQKGGGGG
jgi:predicted nucleic acid-binding protein